MSHVVDPCLANIAFALAWSCSAASWVIVSSAWGPCRIRCCLSLSSTRSLVSVVIGSRGAGIAA